MRSASKWKFRVAGLGALGLLALALLPGAPTNHSAVLSVTPAGAREPSAAAAKPLAAKPTILTSAIAPEPPGKPIVVSAEALRNQMAQSVPAAAAAKPVADVAVAPAISTPGTSAAAPASEMAAAAPAAVPDAAAPPDVTLVSQNVEDQSATPPDAAVGGAASGRIGGSAVNARSGPSTSSRTMFVLAAGEAVQVGESNSGWVHVTRADGESGWIYNRFLAAGHTVTTTASAAPRPTRSAPPASSVRVRSPLPVMAAPGGYAQMLFVLEPGEQVRVVDRRGRWVHVITEDGDSGWAPA